MARELTIIKAYRFVQSLLLLAFGGSLLVATPVANRATIISFAALLLSLIGLAILLLSIAAHWRENGSPLVKISPAPRAGSRLVISGIYARIRHPMYLSVFLIAAALALLHGNWIVWIAAALIVLFYSIKLRFEERLLQQQFPEYAQYRKRSGALLPRLGRS